MIVTLSLPDDTYCLLKEDSDVDFSTPFFEKRTETMIHVEVAKKLSISPDKIFRYLKKLVGEKVAEDEIIAEKKGFMSNVIVKSPVSGEIQEINHDKGVLIVKTESDEKKTTYCYFKGKVKKIRKKEFDIEFGRVAEFSIKEASSFFGGEVYFFEDGKILKEDELSGKIVLAEKIGGLTEVKSEALGCAGFVTSEKLAEATSLPTCLIKNHADFEKIRKLKLSSCLIDKKNSRILFYP